MAEEPNEALRRTARITGVWYLGLAVTGLVGFALIRPQVYMEGNAAATLSNLTDREWLARLGLGVEIAIVATQALAAIWFYKLFHSINEVAAFALAVFGIVNAVAIMASAIFMASAISVAHDTQLAPGGEAAATAQLLYVLSGNSWGVGDLFFGLWLIPMGYIAASSARMPVWLGRILIVGGVGYVVAAFVSYGVAGAPSWLATALPLPATVGEFWMIGYLLTKGIRRP